MGRYSNEYGSPGHSTMIRRRTPLWMKAVLGVGAIVVIRLMWSWLFTGGDPKMQASLLVGDYNMGPNQVEGQFRGSSCVYINGECVPENQANIHLPAKGLYTFGNNFYLDGSPFRILSGSFHYFRTQPAQWGDRLLKMKAAGLNTVTTYIPWNLHEQVRGQFNFGGLWDIEAFIKHVQNVGLKLIVRPGPYICSEWEFGGLPSWLLSDPNMIVRSSACKAYLQAVEDYFSKLLPILAKHQYKKGNGPIIAFQVENEFGSYGKDPEYLIFLKGLFDKYGIDEFLITSDGKFSNGYRHLDGAVDGALITTNFMRGAEENLNHLQKIQPNKPLMVTEFWAGWFDHWGEKHHRTGVEDFINTVEYIIGHRNASINFYMFTGGTNFEFWNGANNSTDYGYGATITSYDYDAPISECGDLHEKYFAIQKLIKKLGLGPKEWETVPQNPHKTSYGDVTLKNVMYYYDVIMLLEDKITLDKIVPMEMLPINNLGGQGYGFLLYQTDVSRPQERMALLEIDGKLEDRGQILVNGVEIAVFPHKTRYQFSAELTAEIPLRSGENHLDILVENMGRVNFKHLLNEERKGIEGSVLVDKEKPKSWRYFPLEFDNKFMNALKTSGSHLWKTFKAVNIPALYQGWIELKNADLQDSFLDMAGWTKGVVFLNGHNLGRYWNLGPQRTLYVPAPLLVEGMNEILIFELHQAGTKVTFIDRPILDAEAQKT